MFVDVFWVVCALFSSRVEGFFGSHIRIFVHCWSCSSQQLLLSSPTIILNNISSLLPFVSKMSQQQVGSLILTIDVDDLMSVLYRISFVSFSPLMGWLERFQSSLHLV